MDFGKWEHRVLRKAIVFNDLPAAKTLAQIVSKDEFHFVDHFQWCIDRGHTDMLALLVENASYYRVDEFIRKTICDQDRDVFSAMLTFVHGYRRSLILSEACKSEDTWFVEMVLNHELCDLPDICQAACTAIVKGQHKHVKLLLNAAKGDRYYYHTPLSWFSRAIESKDQRMVDLVLKHVPEKYIPGAICKTIDERSFAYFLQVVGHAQEAYDLSTSSWNEPLKGAARCSDVRFLKHLTRVVPDISLQLLNEMFNDAIFVGCEDNMSLLLDLGAELAPDGRHLKRAARAGTKVSVAALIPRFKNKPGIIHSALMKSIVFKEKISCSMARDRFECARLLFQVASPAARGAAWSQHFHHPEVSESEWEEAFERPKALSPS